MKQFTILGERCSGTHFLQHAMLRNFELSYDKYHKHFFGHCPHSDQYQTDTLFICIVRDPIEWINSLYQSRHHVPKPLSHSINAFLTQEWYSINEEGPSKGEEIMDDRHIENASKRYTSIFELRKIKNKYLMEYPIKNKILIHYEDLRDNYIEVLTKIMTLFDLKKKQDEFVFINKYKGTYAAEYTPKGLVLSQKAIDYIIQHVDLQQEHELGYLKNQSID
jgi:hypothetical protein